MTDDEEKRLREKVAWAAENVPNRDFPAFSRNDVEPLITLLDRREAALAVYEERDRVTPYNGDRLDERIAELEGHSREELAASYACALVNWDNALGMMGEREAERDALRDVATTIRNKAQDWLDFPPMDDDDFHDGLREAGRQVVRILRTLDTKGGDDG